MLTQKSNEITLHMHEFPYLFYSLMKIFLDWDVGGGK
jgi:hypothetical protein